MRSIKYSAINNDETSSLDEYQPVDLLIPKPNYLKEKSSCFPVRSALISWVFFGVAICYALRANLSVAIIAMAKPIPFKPNGTTNSTSCSLTNMNVSTNEMRETGEFDWDEDIQGIILSSFFYGYFLTQIPGGLLAEKYGGKRVFGLGMLLAIFATLLTPVAARLHIAALVFVRFLAGFGEGVTFPSYYCLYSHWVPYQERGKVLSFTNSGAHIGTIIAMPTAGWLCFHDSLGGWPSVFYVSGIVGSIWLVFWIFLVHDRPEDSPFISSVELDYIIENRKTKKCDLQFQSVPWKKILSSIPVWALALTKFSGSWTYYIMLTELPTYMKSFLNYSVKKSGFLDSIVFSAIAISSILCGILSDYVRSKKWISISVIRKSFQAIATFGPAIILCIIPFMECDVTSVLCLLVFTMALVGFISGGESPTALDMAAEYVGIVFGITNCFANCAGILAPLTTGYMLKHIETTKHWYYVFYLAAVVNVVGGFAFLFFGSAAPQSWSRFQPQSLKL